MKWRLFQVKNVCKNIKKQHVKMSKNNMFKWTCGLFGPNYRVAALSTLYLNVLKSSYQV